jgi:hypothetical protein
LDKIIFEVPVCQLPYVVGSTRKLEVFKPNIKIK